MTETAKPGGKGRPTPKRSEAQKKRRGPVGPAPTSRREAAKQMRARSGAKRVDYRRALREGDESRYPPLAAGPERALVRDVVDSRRTLAVYALPGWGLGVAISLIPALRAVSSALLLAIIGVLVADTISCRREIRRALAAHWPNGTKEWALGTLVRYGLARNVSVRRWRLPRPRVKRGDTVS